MTVETVDRIQDELQFVAKYKAKLKKREKHGTIREGRRAPIAMQIPVRITETGEELGSVVIDEVRWLKLKEIGTPEILRYEYPSDLVALRKDLSSLYPELTKESWVTFFRFRFLDERKGRSNPD